MNFTSYSYKITLKKALVALASVCVGVVACLPVIEANENTLTAVTIIGAAVVGVRAAMDWYKHHNS